MKRTLCALALIASFMPACASAQPNDQGGPSTQVRAGFEKIRDDAKTAAYKSISPAHQAQVQAIVDKVNAGQLEPRDAGTQIDGILTGDEQKSVLAAQEQMRDQMRSAIDAAGGPEAMGPGAGGPGGPGGPGGGGGMGPGAGPSGPGGGPGGPGGPGGGFGGRRAPDAGRALLMLSITPEKMRELRQKARGGQ